MTNKLYVFAPTPDSHVLAGTLSWNDKVGTFKYDDDYLAHPDRFSLDPRNLPLSKRNYTTTNNDGVFGVLADVGPDSWGRSVIEKMHKQQPANPLEYLISGNGDGVGAVRFSLSRSALGLLPNHLNFKNINTVGQIEQELDDGQILEHDRLQQIWAAGSSIGGARPKLTVEEDGVEWLVKLAKNNDTVNMAMIECACLQISKKAGIDVPNARLINVTKRPALMVERFDRNRGIRHHYLSAHALLNMHRVGPKDVVSPGGICTYGGLVSMAQHGLNLQCGPQIFARMIINVLLGNTDDHGRNFGFLKPMGQSWTLAPAFDIVVHGGNMHALGLGKGGRLSTLENAVSDLSRFHLTPSQARPIIDLAINSVRTLPKLLIDLGATSSDQEWVSKRLLPVGDEQANIITQRLCPDVCKSLTKKVKRLSL